MSFIVDSRVFQFLRRGFFPCIFFPSASGTAVDYKGFFFGIDTRSGTFVLVFVLIRRQPLLLIKWSQVAS